MTKQQFFNICLTLIGFLLAWSVTNIFASIAEANRKIEVTQNNLNQVSVLVAGDYVKKSDLKESMKDVADKLQRIEDKLDKKADK